MFPNEIKSNYSSGKRKFIQETARSALICRLNVFIEDTDAIFAEYYRYVFGIGLSNYEQGSFARSRLLLLLTGLKSDAIDVATAIEITHHASLIIDDLIDGARVRRGRPSFFIQYGEQSAVLFSFKMLSDSRNLIINSNTKNGLNIIKKIDSVVDFMIAAEISDSSQIKIKASKREFPVYYNIIKMKTGELYGAIADFYAYLSPNSLSPSSISKLREFLIEIGSTHQMYDEKIDVNDKFINDNFLSNSFVRNNHLKSIYNVNDCKKHLNRCKNNKDRLIESVKEILITHPNKNLIMDLLSDVYGDF